MKTFRLTLIGGDTNKGPLSITIQVIGVSNNKILYRSTAKINDDVYVTGVLGGASAALIFKKKRDKLNYKKFEKLYTKYEYEKKFRKQIPAIEVWNKILESQIQTGTPYMLYQAMHVEAT